MNQLNREITMATKFKHGGIDIEFNTVRGDFSATVNGKNVRKPSLDAMKKHIDNTAKSTFAPFTALARKDDYGATPVNDKDFNVYEVIGIEKCRGRYKSNNHQFLLGPRGSRTRERVMVDSPENRKAVKAHDDYREETARIRNEREDRERELARAIKYHVADDYK